MFIDVVECPHAGGVFTGQNTSGTLNLNRWVYRRSELDNIVAALSGGGREEQQTTEGDSKILI
jgi:hypothetical protein